MKYLVVIALLAFFIQAVVCDDDDYCVSDNHCEWDECCKKNFWGTSRRCVDKGDDIGDRCGGDHYCDTCTDGLVCVPDPSSIINNFRRGTGSCQYKGWNY